MKKNIVALLILIGCSSYTFSQNTEQQTIAVAGDDLISENIQLSWTLGQAIASSSSNNNVFIVEGFQQNSVITIPLGAAPEDNIITIYPNPTTDFIRLNSDGNIGTIRYRLQSLKGEILLEKEQSDFYQTHEIDLLSYSRGVYLLTVTMYGGDPKQFKIIKK